MSTTSTHCRTGGRVALPCLRIGRGGSFEWRTAFCFFFASTWGAAVMSQLCLSPVSIKGKSLKSTTFCFHFVIPFRNSTLQDTDDFSDWIHENLPCLTGAEGDRMSCPGRLRSGARVRGHPSARSVSTLRIRIFSDRLRGADSPSIEGALLRRSTKES